LLRKAAIVSDQRKTERRPACSGVMEPGPRARQPQRILVVDDNRDAADMLGEFLTIMGHDVRVVYDGREALRALPEFAAQVVLLDIGLPELDGWEVARRMREVQRTALLRIIAVTGYGEDKDHQRSRRAGIDHHVVKPANPRVLEALIASHQ
jgi:DNA-binding response OmpR family regulator